MPKVIVRDLKQATVFSFTQSHIIPLFTLHLSQCLLSMNVSWILAGSFLPLKRLVESNPMKTKYNTLKKYRILTNSIHSKAFWHRYVFRQPRKPCRDDAHAHCNSWRKKFSSLGVVLEKTFVVFLPSIFLKYVSRAGSPQVSGMFLGVEIVF